MKQNINIGQLIKNRLNEQKRIVAWFANELYIDCSNLHKTLRNSGGHIDAELLSRISTVMNCNFFIYYYPPVQDNKNNMQTYIQ
jgi:hypothetical protein